MRGTCAISKPSDPGERSGVVDWTAWGYRASRTNRETDGKMPESICLLPELFRISRLRLRGQICNYADGVEWWYEICVTVYEVPINLDKLATQT